MSWGQDALKPCIAKCLWNSIFYLKNQHMLLISRKLKNSLNAFRYSSRCMIDLQSFFREVRAQLADGTTSRYSQVRRIKKLPDMTAV